MRVVDDELSAADGDAVVLQGVDLVLPQHVVPVRLLVPLVLGRRPPRGYAEEGDVVDDLPAELTRLDCPVKIPKPPKFDIYPDNWLTG